MAECTMNQSSQAKPSTPQADTATERVDTTADSTPKRRSFRGLSLEERQQARRERLIEAGLQVYGTQGFFAVTVRDVCAEAKLTERYFYESFKNSEQLFKVIYLQLIEHLQQLIMAAMMHAAGDPRRMIEAGLRAFLDSLKNDPRMARILFVDAILVHELHGNAIHEAVARFDRMTQAFFMLMLPHETRSHTQMSLVSTGLNGYVTHIAIRWVMGGFKEPMEEVLTACQLVYHAFLDMMKRVDSDHGAKLPTSKKTKS
jgi:AcrR family transcriptional regulator